MNRRQCPRFAFRLLGLFMVILALGVGALAEWKEKVLYSFQGGTDGYTPVGGVVFDKAGNLYGVNSWGGDSSCSTQGCGTVFELSPRDHKGAWSETVIYAFRGVNTGAGDGYTPEGSVIIDWQGNLYGTTSMGGTGPCVFFGSAAGCGIVYELSPPKQKGGHWRYSVLYNFQGGNDGYFPIGDLVFDSQGNLYGATWFGGGKGSTCNLYYGGNCGSVFRLSPPKKKGGMWEERILHRFSGGTDGANPNGELVLDSKGAIYGTTVAGGYDCPHDSGQGCGTLFELTAPAKGSQWTERILHRFQAKTDGARPAAGMTFDSRGDLYGTSDAAVFRMTPPTTGSGIWKQTILYKLNSHAYNPRGTLIFDASGNLYGTTYSGNTFSGTAFQLKAPSQAGGGWAFGILHGFTGSPDGAQPAANLIFDKHGSLYSTTQGGGTGQLCGGGCGTVFEVSR
jgi:hypothetical protein